MDPNAEARDRGAAANVVHRAVGIAVSGITGKPAIDAVADLARETGRTVVARVTAGRQLHAALALAWNLETFAAPDAHRVRRTSAAAGEYTLLDGSAVEIVATGLDAHQAVSAIGGALTDTIRRTGPAERAGRARNGGATRARHAARAGLTRRPTGARRAPRATAASGTAEGRTPRSIISATNRACRDEQPRSKPSISHEGLLRNKFTEIFRHRKSWAARDYSIGQSCGTPHNQRAQQLIVSRRKRRLPTDAEFYKYTE